MSEPYPSAVDEATSVYRYYDANDVLIYVGITKRRMNRSNEHWQSAEWWPFVARQEVEHLPSRAAALKREKHLIQHHRTPFNVQHNPWHAEMKAIYLAHIEAAAGAATESEAEMLRRVNKQLPLTSVGSGDALVFVSAPVDARMAGFVDLKHKIKIVDQNGTRVGNINERTLRGGTLFLRPHFIRPVSPTHVRAPLRFLSVKPMKAEIARVVLFNEYVGIA